VEGLIEEIDERVAERPGEKVANGRLKGNELEKKIAEGVIIVDVKSARALWS
jgi:hypothetical protein